MGAALPGSAAQPEEAKEESSTVIITLQEHVESPRDVAEEMTKSCDCTIDHVYESALKGFSVKGNTSSLTSFLHSDNKVDGVFMNRKYKAHVGFPETVDSGEEEKFVQLEEERVPNDVERINADTLKNRTGEGVNVAVIDSGIERDHPDLKENIKGGRSMVTDDPSNWTDEFGHGTHVAGTVAAPRNGEGVVGVAPDANLYAVRVLTQERGGMDEIIAGVDWVGSSDSPDIDVANMSLGGPAFFGEEPMHEAIKGATNNGVTFTVSAGNSSADAEDYVPAKFDEVITVAAMADSDGKPGGKGPKLDLGDKAEPMADDSFASFSNYGSTLDIIAPGVKVLSSWAGKKYKEISGTSMSSPMVAGTAAVLVGENEDLSPREVQNRLVNTAAPAPGCGGANQSEQEEASSNDCGWDGYPGQQQEDVPMARPDRAVGANNSQN